MGDLQIQPQCTCGRTETRNGLHRAEPGRELDAPLQGPLSLALLHRRIVLAIWILFRAAATTEWVLLFGCAIGLLALLKSMLPIWTTEIAVTNHRLIVKRGWLSRSTDELQLKAIEQVNFHQGVLGRLFDFGSVDVHGTGSDDLIIPAVVAPLGFLKAIETAASPPKSITQTADEPARHKQSADSLERLDT